MRVKFDVGRLSKQMEHSCSSWFFDRCMAVFFVFQIGEDEEKCQLFPWETNDRSKAENKRGYRP